MFDGDNDVLVSKFHDIQLNEVEDVRHMLKSQQMTLTKSSLGSGLEIDEVQDEFKNLQISVPLYCDEWDADNYVISRDDAFVIGIADPGLRHAVYRAFRERGAHFLTLIHPWSEVAPDVILGEGNILQRGTRIATGSVIGNANYFNGAVHIASDVVAGDCNFVGPGAMLLEESRLGDGNSLGVRSLLQAGSAIGDANMIAPGSVVCGSYGDRHRMAGNPAVIIGETDC